MAAVNEALSELYIEDEDHEKLRESVDDYDNFDQVTTKCHRERHFPLYEVWQTVLLL